MPETANANHIPNVGTPIEQREVYIEQLRAEVSRLSAALKASEEQVKKLLPLAEDWAKHQGQPTDGTGYYGSVFKPLTTSPHQDGT